MDPHSKKTFSDPTRWLDLTPKIIIRNGAETTNNNTLPLFDEAAWAGWKGPTLAERCRQWIHSTQTILGNAATAVHAFQGGTLTGFCSRVGLPFFLEFLDPNGNLKRKKNGFDLFHGEDFLDDSVSLN